MPASKWCRTRSLHIFLTLFALFFICSSAAQQAPAAPKFVVVKPVANMYRQPSEDAGVISQAIYATNVISAEEQNTSTLPGWVKVRTPDDYAGWMQTSTLRPLAEKAYATEGSVVRVAQFSANIYREPDVTLHAPLVTAPWESRLEVLDEKVADGSRWLKVYLPDDRIGFVQSGDVSANFSGLTIEQTIALARKFLGVTYTWGGASSFGYDCSGFMQMLVRQRGALMPRDAYMQAAWSGVVAVERKDLQPGDLLYFGSRPDKITHTGMYIGNGEFIHDTTHTHPVIQISRLDDMPWTKLLVAARRLKMEAPKK